MTLKQQLFADAYLGNGGNATAAARSAGYKGNDDTLSSVGEQNLRKLEVIRAISSKTSTLAAERGIMPADEVLSRLTRQARASIDLILDENGRPSTKAALAKGASDLIKSVAVANTKFGENVRIEIHDSQAAAIQLGRYHGLFVDRIVSDTLTAEFAAQVSDIITETASEFILDEVTRNEFLRVVKSRLQRLVGGASMPEPDSTP